MRHVLVMFSALAVAIGCVSSVGAKESTGTLAHQPRASVVSRSTQSTTESSMTKILPSGVKIEDLVVGTGAEAVPGKIISVHYTGTLANGKKFDSSFDHPGKKPLMFKLGSGMVIKGWDDGLVGMKVGGKRRLTIPPEQAYGADGFPPVIPPNATLIFETELIEVK